MLNLLKRALVNSLLLISSILFTHIVNAHNPNTAFFDITEQDKIVKIEVEFPWSLRNSLEVFDTLLDKSSSSSDIRNSLFNYINANLILTGTKNNKFKLLNVEELEQGEHSHQSNFRLTYTGENLNTITNKIMFNISRKQTNSHSFSSKSQSLKFVTSPHKDSFRLDIPQQPNLNLKSWLIGLLALASLVIGLFFLKKINKV